MGAPASVQAPAATVGTARRPRSRGWWLRLGLGCAIVAALVWRVHPLAVLERAVAADPRFFLAAFAAYLASQGASALRLAMLARGAGFAEPLARIVQVHAAGACFGLVTPTTIGNDACRAVYLGRGRHVVQAASVVALDRLQGLVVLGGVGAAAALLVASIVLPAGVARALAVGGVTALGGAILLLLCLQLRSAHPIRRVLGTAATRPSLLATTALVSVVVVGLQVASQVLLAAAIGLHVPLAHAALYHPLVVIGGTLPITLAGVGTREATYVWMLAPAGIATESALAWSVLWLAVGLLNGLVAGLVVLGSGLSWPTAPAPAADASRPRSP